MCTLLFGSGLQVSLRPDTLVKANSLNEDFALIVNTLKLLCHARLLGFVYGLFKLFHLLNNTFLLINDILDLAKNFVSKFYLLPLLYIIKSTDINDLPCWIEIHPSVA